MNIEHNNINVCICGHSQIGKSTILGHLLVELGLISTRMLTKYKEKAFMLGEEEHMYALMVHLLKDEEDIKKTIYPSRVRIQTAQKTIILIDTPGHRDYMKNLIFGIFQSDCAILVVEGPGGLQEETTSVLNILRGFEIPIIAVIINKMDIEKYSESRFVEVKEQILKLLSELGFKTDDLPFCALSGLEGEGLVKYHHFNESIGVPLKQVLENLDMQIIRGESPLRLTVRRNEVKKVPGVGTVVVGEVESGVLHKNDEIIFEPISTIKRKKVTAKAKSIQLSKGVVASPGIPQEKAVPRNIIGIAIRHSDLDLYELLSQCNNVGGLISDPPSVATDFLAEITVVDHPIGISKGYMPVIHPHVDQYPGRIVNILSAKSPNEDWKEVKTDFVRTGQQAIVKIHTKKPLSIEECKNIPWMSKFIIRDGRIVGFGKCIKIINSQT